MNWKPAVAICSVALFPSLALAANPTKADVEKVMQPISADPAKMKAYCDIGPTIEKALAEKQKDSVKRKELDKQVEDLHQKLGPDFIKLMDDMQKLNDAEFDALDREFAPYGKKCPK